MANFTPPVRANQENSPYEVDTELLVKRCMGHFTPNHFAYGVWILKASPAGITPSNPVGTVLEYNPPALYDSSGHIAVFPEDRILYFFQGNATYRNIASDAATYLTAAGYTLS